MIENNKDSEIERYVNQKAPILYMIMDENGVIRQMNRFSSRLFGDHLIGRPFTDIIVDFHNIFHLPDAIIKPGAAHLLNIKTRSGITQTYYFHFHPLKTDILVFGHVDIGEIETLNNELVAANQELNNLTRQLSIRNRELKEANEKILEMTRTDALTQLSNRRFFDESIQLMASMAKRKLKPLSLIMTDIDHFKEINDSFGHDVGDRVLQGYSILLKKATRSEDLVARYGGEEFAILLALTDIHQAYALAERIRIKLSRSDLIGNGWVVTASGGVSQLIGTEPLDAFIKRADNALYAAKASGRNQTVLADQSHSFSEKGA